MFKVIETFSGIGAQAKALERIKYRDGYNYEVINTCDWDINAILAYDLMHNHGINTIPKDEVDDDQIDAFLSSKTLSLNGKQSLNEKTYSRFTSDFKRVLYSAIKSSKNLVSITDVSGEDILPDVDLLTYSFPCQDLSMCGYWHGNKSGIAREAHNRSGMLWEVERILKEMHDQGKGLPHFLVMENVTNILSATHKDDFDDWKSTLTELGYYNKIYRLNAKNFGVPQKRERAYMISILCNDEELLDKYFEDNNLENTDIAKKYQARTFKLKNVLRTDYRKKIYRKEAEMSQPNDTPSRKRILNENDMLYKDRKINEINVNTVTTKQDRNPNSGLLSFDSKREGKSNWRYLTPRECFMLMGFDEEDFDYVINGNVNYTKNNALFNQEKLYKMAGNSICVDVLEALFKQIYEINEMIFC